MKQIFGQDIKKVHAWLKSRGFHRPEDYRDSFIERRLGPKLKVSGAGSVGEFLAGLRGSAKAEEAFLNKFLVPTTEFFRNREVFEEVADIVAEGRQSKPGRRLRVLCAACSTGEEPYSLAMLLEERGVEYRIVALDRCLASLKNLRSGHFTEKAMSKVDKALKERYFITAATGMRASRKLARKILPVCWDLGRGLPPGPFDLIFIRNVLIYLTDEAQRRLLAEGAKAITHGGLLVLGKVESLPAGPDYQLVTFDRERRIYRKVAT